MAKLDIIIHPDPRLKKLCAPVPDVTAELRKLASPEGVADHAASFDAMLSVLTASFFEVNRR